MPFWSPGGLAAVVLAHLGILAALSGVLAIVGKGDPKGHAMTKQLWAISAALVPTKRAFDFNQALMDFGAMTCTARKPKCLVCPMAKFCRSLPWTDPPVKRAKAR